MFLQIRIKSRGIVDTAVTTRRGMCVALYILNRLRFSVVHAELVNGVMKNLFVEVEASGVKLLIGIVYLPHGVVYSLKGDLSNILIKSASVIVVGHVNYNLFNPAKSSMFNFVIGYICRLLTIPSLPIMM